MKGLHSLEAFERGLRADSKQVFGGVGGKKSPARRRSEDTEVEIGRDRIWNVVKLPDELAAQVEAIADAIDVNRTGLARMIIAAGTEAVLRQLETGEGLTLPLRLEVQTEKPGFYHQHLRTVTPLRFEALRARYPWPLQKWKGLHKGDATGTPMPPPESKSSTSIQA
ncbi:hypothetical protein OJ996_08975 [Luteolibacter sp. GHJ8]|uniref:Ribbon-helix-helix protein CopG domain-containing protein n=1 Tax=Luteolibacter rhizosphaerae TaxID=2989719 RepID=A0ABT3G1I8_9BACT|nr:hypothetical protein [Luteolibacter rhizosphaerae]MCW1913705.1 hypothetical protein [Luteolibacter rhizosphaerae]